MELINYLNQNIQLPAGFADEINNSFNREELPKGHQILSANNHSKKVFFFETGLGRSYYLKEGKDITHYFFVEDSFSVAIESVFYNKPSPYNLELLENSIIRSVSYPELKKIVDKSESIDKFIQLLLINFLKSFSDRLYSIQFQSASERYKTMLKNYPDILRRAPLGHIASYLGITQETFSRIRSGK
jgi:CRP-like cAMP-binding protein